MVQHRHAKRALRPVQRFHVAMFAGREDHSQRIDAIIASVFALRIGAPDDAERSRNREQRSDAMLFDDAERTNKS